MAIAVVVATRRSGAPSPTRLLALLWDRFRLGERKLMRRTELRFGQATILAIRAAAELLLILMGVSFVAFQGSSALSSLYESLGLSDVTPAIPPWRR